MQRGVDRFDVPPNARLMATEDITQRRCYRDIRKCLADERQVPHPLTKQRLEESRERRGVQQTA